MKLATRLSFAVLLGLLAGCYSTGRQFARPNLDAFELRKTTAGEVIASFGQPKSVASTTRNDKKIERFQYQYFTAQGYATGSGPIGRTASYFFSDGVMVGYLYTSNYPGDSTDFDEAKARSIIQGKSTRREMESLLGKPVGMAVYPLIDFREDTELRYSYIGNTGLMGSGTIIKNAIFRVSDGGMVTDAKVSIEEKK